MTIELYPQSDKDQFVNTSDAEKYYQNQTFIPVCNLCNKKVAYNEWDFKFAEFACHGNILRFYFVDGFLARVEELLDK
ncbi:MAG TPA: hypothetical protein VFQ56_02470 [Flavobacterium sp.]|nr:hypothetical protein [Flavobacterium sp.]